VRPSPPSSVPRPETRQARGAPGIRTNRVLESIAELPRLAVARTLRAHPEWSLANVFGVIERGGPRAAALGALTIAELLEGSAITDAPSIDYVRRRRAMRCNGAEFDRLVLEVLCEAQGEVGASYLRARLGGPRWKLQSSLGRVVAAGKVIRTGTTSATRYRVVRA
jgi:hypothetical protein